jgi:hypothetical protein
MLAQAHGSARGNPGRPLPGGAPPERQSRPASTVMRAQPAAQRFHEDTAGAGNGETSGRQRRLAEDPSRLGGSCSPHSPDDQPTGAVSTTKYGPDP